MHVKMFALIRNTKSEITVAAAKQTHYHVILLKTIF